jgi:hypothetical protein
MWWTRPTWSVRTLTLTWRRGVVPVQLYPRLARQHYGTGASARGGIRRPMVPCCALTLSRAGLSRQSPRRGGDCRTRRRDRRGRTFLCRPRAQWRAQLRAAWPPDCRGTGRRPERRAGDHGDDLGKRPAAHGRDPHTRGAETDVLWRRGQWRGQGG